MNSCHTIIRIFPVQPYHYKYLYSREASNKSNMPSKIRKIFFEQFTPSFGNDGLFSKYRGYENSFTRDDTHRQVLTKKRRSSIELRLYIFMMDLSFPQTVNADLILSEQRRPG